MTVPRGPFLHWFASALGAVALAGGARWLLGSILDTHLSTTPFLLAVVLACWAAGWRAGVLALLLGLLLCLAVFCPLSTSAAGAWPRAELILTALWGVLIVAFALTRERTHRQAEALKRQLLSQQQQREQVEAALRDREEKLHLLLDSGRMTIQEWALTAESSHGEPPGPPRPDDRPDFNQIHPDDRARVESALVRTLEKGVPLEVEFRVVTPTNEIRHVAEKGQLRRGQDGQPTHLIGVQRDVSEQKRLQEEIAHHQRLVRQIAKASPHILLVFDHLTQQTVYYNGRSGSLLGYTPEQARQLGALLPEHQIHPDDRVVMLQNRGRLEMLPEGQFLEQEVRVRHVSGEYRWLRCRQVVLSRTRDGRLAQTLELAQDITEARLAAEAQQRSEERFRLAAHAVHGLIYDADLTTGLVERTCGLYEVVGHHPEEVPPTGEWWLHQVHPEDQAELARARTQALSDGGERVVVEYRVRHRDGHWLRVVDRSLLVRDDNDRVIRQVGCIQDITEQRQAEERLRESEQRFRLISEGMPQFVSLLDGEGRTLYSNPLWAEYSGLRGGQRIRAEWTTLVHPEDLRLALELWWQALQTGTPLETEVRFRRAVDGVYRWFLMRIWPVRGPEGRVRGWVSVSMDIDDRKQVEEAARESAHSFAALLEIVPQLVWVARPDGAAEYFNQGWYGYTGQPPGQAREQGWAVLLHPDDRDRSLRRWQWSLETGQPYETEYRLRGGNGSYRWFLTRAVPLRDDQQQILRWFGTCTDIEGRKQSERELQKFKFISDNANDVILLTDREGRFLYANATASERLGYPGEELLALRLPDIDPVLTLEQYQALFDRGQRETVPPFEAIHRRKDGCTCPVEISAVGLELSGQVFLASFCRDITERKRVEEGLREADRRKDEFLATLAHELRNPLAPIRNALQVLRLADADEPAAWDAREAMDRQLAQLVRLIDDLLDISRITRNKLHLRRERIELSAVVASAVETSRPLIEANGHTLEISLPSSPVYLDGDRMRLAQVFANLLNNSAKYTERGGRIGLAAQREGDVVRVRVQDNGLGIPREALPHIFDLFTQVDPSLERSQGGLGIGLSLVRGLVQMHGGSVSATSAGPGRGSEFVVRLPALAEELQPEQLLPPRSAPAQPPTSVKRRILVVDDNRDAASTLTVLLGMLGHQVGTAYDGVEALETMQHFHPELILLDIGMPRMNGYDVCRRIRQQPWGHDVVIIALTGWGQDQDRQQSYEAGFNLHLVKPVDPADLLSLLAQDAWPPTWDYELHP